MGKDFLRRKIINVIYYMSVKWDSDLVKWDYFLGPSLLNNQKKNPDKYNLTKFVLQDSR